MHRIVYKIVLKSRKLVLEILILYTRMRPPLAVMFVHAQKKLCGFWHFSMQALKKVPSEFYCALSLQTKLIDLGQVLSHNVLDNLGHSACTQID